MPTDEHFAMALNELLTQQFDTGLFARCFAMTGGDEARTKAKYIEIRAQAIHRAQLEAIKELRLLQKSQEIEQKKQIEAQIIAMKKSKDKALKQKRLEDLKKKEALRLERKAQKIRASEEEQKALESEFQRTLRPVDPFSYEEFLKHCAGSVFGVGLLKRREMWLKWRKDNGVDG